MAPAVAAMDLERRPQYRARHRRCRRLRYRRRGRPDAPCRRRVFCSTFPMLVPSLSWLNIRFSMYTKQMVQKRLRQLARLVASLGKHNA
eukprot:COSAG02_NODE_37265_length_444_cov_0.747826_1_plen_88_part_10